MRLIEEETLDRDAELAELRRLLLRGACDPDTKLAAPDAGVEGAV
jgi:hypothetical protein